MSPDTTDGTRFGRRRPAVDGIEAANGTTLWVWLACAAMLASLSLTACKSGGGDDGEGGSGDERESPPEPYVESPEGGGGMLYQFVPFWGECPDGDMITRGQHELWRQCIHSVRSERAGDGARVRLELTRRVFDEEGYMRREQKEAGTTTPGGDLPDNAELVSWDTFDYHPNGQLRRHISWTKRFGAAVPERFNVDAYNEPGVLVLSVSRRGDEPRVTTTATLDEYNHPVRHEIDEDDDGTADKAVVINWGVPSHLIGRAEPPPTGYYITSREFDDDMDGATDHAEYYFYQGGGDQTYLGGIQPRATLFDEDMDGRVDRVRGSRPYDVSRCHDHSGIIGPVQMGSTTVITDVIGRPDCVPCRSAEDVTRCP